MSGGEPRKRLPHVGAGGSGARCCPAGPGRGLGSAAPRRSLPSRKNRPGLTPRSRSRVPQNQHRGQQPPASRKPAFGLIENFIAKQLLPLLLPVTLLLLQRFSAELMLSMRPVHLGITGQTFQPASLLFSFESRFRVGDGDRKLSIQRQTLRFKIGSKSKELLLKRASF